MHNAHVNDFDLEPIIIRKRNIDAKSAVDGPPLKKQRTGNKKVVDPLHLNEIEILLDKDNYTTEKVPLSFRQEMARARLKNNLTQKDLAMKMNEPLDMIKGYENGTIIAEKSGMLKIKSLLKF